eukprot:CAMPEP_0181124452 /NCGR_PEP_ID=MMETSP1071-20121207/26491_1 /TAXON_ID=35127 /ORGANISM="Thalassiosira sp., Strain NH16" /LENGTH=635 /DNA_ID=CAMNT_0023209763 /DNA_START=418 /DNA_END=2325 /DNA_ORIENTATION=+
MNELKFIVGRLQDEPFNIAIRAVDFDDKPPIEHLQILNDVLASLSSHLKADVQAVPRDEVVEEMIQFLLVHKYKLIPSDEYERLDWTDGVRNGRKETIYPILHWVLSDYETLRKRTYLSQYLLPVDVPTDYLLQTNGNLEELLDAYKELQAEFIEVHKHYESTSAKNDRSASDVISDVKRMEEEEQQLLDRLQREQAERRGDSAFQHLLVEASKMRESQDEEIRLEGQQKQQLQSLAMTKQRLKQARRILDVIAACEGKPIGSIITVLEEESQKSADHLESIIEERHKVETMLLKAEKEAELDKTEHDIEYVMEMAAQLEVMLCEKHGKLDSLPNRDRKLSKLASLKQDIVDATTKLNAMKEDIGTQIIFRELLMSTNQELCESIDMLGADGECMNINELAAMEEKLNRKIEAHAALKLEMTEIEKGISELKQTEEVLKRQRYSHLEHVQDEEKRAGVAGFQDINQRLQHTSLQTASVNEIKSKCLDEISTMVQTIAHTLESKRQELEPKIEELKQQRVQYQELQEAACKKKAEYERIESKLMHDNKDAESECSRLHETWLQKERSYHLMSAKPSELGGLYPDQRQNFGMELSAREQQGGGMRSKEYISNQKAMFANLKKLLELKETPSVDASAK